MAVHLHRIAPLHPYSPESGDAGRTRLALIEKTLRDNWLVGKSIDFLHEQLTGSTGMVLSRRQLLRYFAKLGWRRRGAAATPEQRACIARAVHGMHVARGMGAAAAILSQFSLFLTTLYMHAIPNHLPLLLDVVSLLASQVIACCSWICFKCSVRPDRRLVHFLPNCVATPIRKRLCVECKTGGRGALITVSGQARCCTSIRYFFDFSFFESSGLLIFSVALWLRAITVKSSPIDFFLAAQHRTVVLLFVTSRAAVRQRCVWGNVARCHSRDAALSLSNSCTFIT